jgi:uncharacterized protein YuzE
MGSILNFIIPKGSKHIQQAPVTNEVFSNYSYSIHDFSINFSFELKKDCKNIILVEVVDGYKSLIRFLKESPGLINFVKSNNICIITCSVADPCPKNEFKTISNKLKELEILDKIFFIDTNKNLDNQNNVFAFHYFLEEAVNSKEQLFGQINDLGYVSKKIDKSELDKFRNKKFLSFQRNNDKEHRLSLLHDYLTNDFSDSYFSFLQTILYAEPYQDSSEVLTYEEYNKNLPIELDTNGNIHGFRTDNTFQKELFLDSVIHIVSETSFSQNELFISEKTLKPILNFQPFIIIGPFGILKELKKVGFKTFGDFWDESYDETKDSKNRYLKIRKLILELNSKSINELNNLYKIVKDICIYNNEVFYNMKNKNSLKEIFKVIENER